MEGERYHAEAQSFKLPSPEWFNYGFDVIDSWADKAPNKLALISVDQDVTTEQKLTFSDLKRESNKFANGLLRMGLRRGDRVLVVVPHMPEWFFAILGMTKIGVVFIPTTVMSTTKDIEYRVRQAGVIGILCANSCAHIVDEVREKLANVKHFVLFKGEKPGWVGYKDVVKNSSEALHVVKTRSDEVMVIFFTSGTTGLAKMVRHTHTYPIGHIVTAKYFHSISEDDFHWTVADTGWAKTAWGFYGQWLMGAAIIQYCYSKIEPHKIFELIEKHNVTSFCAPPTLYRMMVRDHRLREFPSLRSCTSAGEPLNPEVISLWEKATNITIREFYGQTETTAVVGNSPLSKLKPGSMGLPAPGYDIQLVDEEGKIVTTPLQEGIIGVRIKPHRPPGVLLDYWQRPDAMEESLKGDFYLTHDKAYRDEEGYFWFVGRTDDVFKSSGYRIGPFEVESALVEHGAVQEAAVIGVPDETRGFVPKAFVVLVSGHSPSDKLTKELQDYVIKVTAPYKYPRKIEYVKELPKTISGKIRRGELRNMERQKAKL